jgi:hypothetical protein
LPSAGLQGGAHNRRAYRDSAFFAFDTSFAGFSWLYGWWNSTDILKVEAAQKIPQMTLFATSTWEPLPIVTAMATVATPIPDDGVLYISRRPGDIEAGDEFLFFFCSGNSADRSSSSAGRSSICHRPLGGVASQTSICHRPLGGVAS